MGFENFGFEKAYTVKSRILGTSQDNKNRTDFFFNWGILHLKNPEELSNGLTLWRFCGTHENNKTPRELDHFLNSSRC